MKVHILFTGEYANRTIVNVYRTRADAEIARGTLGELLDIEEWDVLGWGEPIDIRDIYRRPPDDPIARQRQLLDLAEAQREAAGDMDKLGRLLDDVLAKWRDEKFAEPATSGMSWHWSPGDRLTLAETIRQSAERSGVSSTHPCPACAARDSRAEAAATPSDELAGLRELVAVQREIIERGIKLGWLS